jgi:hypothetical protein
VKRQSGSHVDRGAPSFDVSLEIYLNYIPLHDDDRALLERWLTDPRANGVWSVIRAHAEQNCGPIGDDAGIRFIHHILATKRAAETESDATAKIAALRADWQKLIAEKLKELKTEIGEVLEQLPSLPDQKLAEKLEITGKRLRGLHPPSSIHHPGCAAIVAALAQEPYLLATYLLW